MPRADLLALTPDDLIALTNRGTVKRAEREVEAGEPSCRMQEADDGTVTAAWSDSASCTLPGGGTVRQGRCTCAATGVCRHLVRSVLAYQRLHQATGPAPAAAEPWDPGSISDDELARHFKPAALARARERFAESLLVELVRSGKPTARFHDLGCTVRFLVPGDPRYTHCDCAEPAPCGHVPLAVWSFRKLAPEKAAGIFSTREAPWLVPAALLDEAEQALLALTEHGMGGAPAAWRDAVGRLEARCRDDGLVWPAEVLAELAQQYERYAQHDARFAPEEVAELVGEFLIRADAIRADTGAVPQPFVRGSRSDRLTEIGSARLVGLGCGVRQRRRAADVNAYLQDVDSGNVVAVGRTFADPAPEAAEQARDYPQLAQLTGLKGISYAALGGGQLLIQAAKRSADGRLILGRARASVQPQAFAWEKLRAPVLAEDFAELRSRLMALPPASLRPRRVAENLHVCPVAGVEAAGFSEAAQAVEAVLRDPGGQLASLHHPYTSRGREGAELLLTRLTANPDALRFVSGQFHLGPGGLVLRPLCLVFQDGPSRTAVQPWVDRRQQAGAAPAGAVGGGAPRDPVAEYPRQLTTSLGELFLVGLRRADAVVARAWQELARQGEALGFARLAERVRELATLLEQKQHAPGWDWQPAGRAALTVAVLTRLARDLE